MRRHVSTWLLMIGLSATGLTGCASTGFFLSANTTAVELSSPNFRLIATDVAGEARAGYVLGVSVALGPEVRTLALARVEGEGLLYREALANLWGNFEAQHGAIANRRLALANIRVDTDALNLLIYTRPRLSIRADVVEFTTQ
jgi:ABC-type transporter Mla MlaB component